MPITISHFSQLSLPAQSSASDCESDESARIASPKVSHLASRPPLPAYETNSGNVEPRSVDVSEALVPWRAGLFGHGESLPTSGRLNYDNTVCTPAAQPCMHHQKYRFDTDDCPKHLNLNVPLTEEIPQCADIHEQPLTQESFDSLKVSMEGLKTSGLIMKYNAYNNLIDYCRALALDESKKIQEKGITYSKYIIKKEGRLTEYGIDFKNGLPPELQGSLNMAISYMRAALIARRGSKAEVIFEGYISIFKELIKLENVKKINDCSLDYIKKANNIFAVGNSRGNLKFNKNTKPFIAILQSNQKLREKWNETMMNYNKPQNCIITEGNPSSSRSAAAGGQAPSTQG